jgi:hydrogenase maturation protease
MTEPVLLLGLGNDILTDDGVGLAAARRVAELAGDRVELREACVATLDLLPLLAGRERAVVVDAYLSPVDPPGTRIRATPDTLPAGFGYRSLHTLPFRDMIALGRRLGLAMPARMSIHGLCVADPATFGTAFTPPVAAAWPAWAEAIAREEGFLGPS